MSYTRPVLGSELKARVREGRLSLGPMMTFDFWPGYLEIFKGEGMDFAIADLEHGSASLRTVEELCRTARLLDLPLIVRPESCVFHLIRKYLDMGAAGLMVPWTERQEQIETLRDAMFVPPRGKRGPGGPAIFANRTLDRAGWDEIEESLFTMIQIESPAGLENLTRLANQPWIDAVMVGPYDLSLSIDRCGLMDDPDLIETIARIHTEAASIGKPAGMVVGTPDQAKRWIDCGIRLLIVSEPAIMVRQHVRGLAGRIRELCPS